MNEDRLSDWYNGQLSDEELTEKELRWLEKRVFSAIAGKMSERPDVTTFLPHKTVQ